jgi:hypothetical protein
MNLTMHNNSSRANARVTLLVFTNWRHHTSLHVNSHGLRKITRRMSLQAICGR